MDACGVVRPQLCCKQQCDCVHHGAMQHAMVVGRKRPGLPDKTFRKMRTDVLLCSIGAECSNALVIGAWGVRGDYLLARIDL